MRDEKPDSDCSLDDFKADCDWQEAFSVAGLDVASVQRIIACDSGVNDEENWIAVVELDTEGDRFAVVDSWCDYTGWDCRSGGTAEMFPSEAMALSGLMPDQAERLGLPHDADN